MPEALEVKNDINQLKIDISEYPYNELSPRELIYLDGLLKRTLLKFFYDKKRATFWGFPIKIVEEGIKENERYPIDWHDENPKNFEMLKYAIESYGEMMGFAHCLQKEDKPFEASDYSAEAAKILFEFFYNIDKLKEFLSQQKKM